MLVADPWEHAAKRFEALSYRHDPVAWTQRRIGEWVWSKQAEILRSVVTNRRTAVKSCHGVGKALALDTPLPTPTGWTTMGAVRLGDELLDEQGQPVTVAAVSEVQHRPTYVVRFDDGTTLTASDNHEWQVVDIRHRPRGIADWRDHWAATVTKTTAELAVTLTSGGQLRWRVPTTRPIAGSDIPMPIGPYALGLWLGDGTSSQAAFICHNDDAPELLTHLAADGVTARLRPSSVRANCTSYGLLGILPALRHLDVLNAKHVPPQVLRASVDTRLSVLQGLMDTDGFVSSGQSVGIDLCDERLADGVAELVVSLGWKAFRSTKAATLDGRTVGTVYRLQFRPDRPVFRLARKTARLGQAVGQRSRHTQRTIVAIDPVPPVATRCVRVDSPTHLFLAGRAMVPTHNSHIASRIAAWWLDVHEPGEAFVVTSAPTYAQVRAILWRYIRQVHKRHGLPGKVNQTEWHIDDEIVAFGRKPADHDEAAFQGIHARRVLVILDEACGIPEQLWIAADALTTNDGCRILAIGNPDNPASHFREVCQANSGWHTIQISAFDSPNLTGENVPDDLAELLISRSWAEEKAAEWGTDNPIYISKVLGDFPSQSPNAVVRVEDVYRCRLSLDIPYTPQQLLPVELGVDVGGGGDLTVIRERRGIQAGREWVSRSDRPETLAPLVIHAINETGATTVKVDSIGIGWGLVGELRNARARGEHKANIVGVNVAEKAAAPERFVNKRAEIWWTVGRQLSSDRGWDLAAMDNGDQTVAELCEPLWELDPAGRIKIESKDDIRERTGGRSPDHADALLLAHYRPSGDLGSFFDQLGR